MRIFFWIFLALIQTLFCLKVLAQQRADTTSSGYLNIKQFEDSLKRKYNFLITNQNQLEFAEQNLAQVFAKLQVVKDHNHNKVIFTHIGDSHLQADYFSGKMRRNLQLEFGNSGRGLVFPYRVAKTNEPPGINSSSNSAWEAKRCIFIEKPMPIGVSGITLKCTDSLSDFAVNITNQQDLDYRFNRITLFHEKGPEYYDLLVLDKQQNIRGFINSNLNNNGNRYTSKLELDSLTSYVKFKSYKKDSSLQKYTQLYGVVFENSTPGVLYHMIGVNGAEYRHYNAASLFHEQVKELNTDLFILSLGTNDVVPAKLNIESFIANVDSMVKHLKTLNPQASIIITSPGDFYRVYRKKKYRNKNTEIASQRLREYCRNNSCAYWDWYTVMGGPGSVLLFAKKGLAQADKLHLTRAGYELQGELLYNALMKSYLTFLANKK